MKIMMLCGSPRTKDGSSAYLLHSIQERLGSANEYLFYGTEEADRQRNAVKIASQMSECDALIIAYPLYVDGIPARLSGLLKAVEDMRPQVKKGIKVYQAACNGFFEAAQNRIAIQMVWKWCEKCGLEKGRAVAVGGSGMIKAAALGHGPCTSIGRVLDRLAEDIREGNSGDEIYTGPDFPRFLYIWAAHMQWRAGARKNGLKLSEIRRRP